jgi:hypothetical protein
MVLNKVSKTGESHTIVMLLALTAIVLLGLISALGAERFAGFANTATPSTITRTVIIFPNGSRITLSEAQATTTPQSIEFRGPVASGEAPGLKVAVYLSNNSVKVNGTLWIKVVFEGEEAFFRDYIMLDIFNSRGERVYGLAVMHPHPTLPLRFEPPKNISYTLSWKAVNVTPGNYTLAIEAGGIKMSILITVTP